MSDAGETGTIGEREVETISAAADLKAGADDLEPVQKDTDTAAKGQATETAQGEGSIVSTVKDGLQSISDLVTGKAPTSPPVCRSLILMPQEASGIDGVCFCTDFEADIKIRETSSSPSYDLSLCEQGSIQLTC